MKEIFKSQMNSVKISLFIVINMVNVGQIFAQQDPQFTNYMYNTISINPAYAGTRDAVSIFGLHRNQWVGLNGAPVTNVASVHMPIKNSNLGFGLGFINDRIGPSTENVISADVSYRIQVSENSTVSFGIKGTANLLNVDYSKLSIEDVTDTDFQFNVENRFTPNVGAGVYWFSEKYYLGLSVPGFLETTHFNKKSQSLATSSAAAERMNLYLVGGYVFDLSPSTKFKPAFITKAVNGSPLQIDATANFMFNEKFIVGAAYRWSASVSGLVGFQINKGLLIGYSYDAETTKLSNYNSGSHEIFLRFELFNSNDKVYSPRFF